MKTAQFQVNPTKRSFSLIEVMIAVTIFSILTVGIFALYIIAMKQSTAGSSQARYVALGRSAEQRMIKEIQRGRIVDVADNPTGNVLGIWSQFTNTVCSRLFFLDADNNMDTVSNNYLKYYDADKGNTSIVCTYVSRITNGPIFQINQVSAPNSVIIRFQVGDSTNVSSTNRDLTGPGYQGVEVRFSAVPRNLREFITDTGE